MNERLKFQVQAKSPNGVRRESTVVPRRNHITVDFGDDTWGTKEALQEIARIEGRTVSSVVREILRRYVSLHANG